MLNSMHHIFISNIHIYDIYYLCRRVTIYVYYMQPGPSPDRIPARASKGDQYLVFPGPPLDLFEFTIISYCKLIILVCRFLASF